jgi:hypothetical protein
MTPRFYKYWRERWWLQILLILVVMAMVVNAVLTRHWTIPGVFVEVISLLNLYSFVAALFTGQVATFEATYSRAGDPWKYWVATTNRCIGGLAGVCVGAFLILLEFLADQRCQPN